MKSGGFFFLFILSSAFCTAQDFDENEFKIYGGVSAGYGFGISKTKVSELYNIDFDCLDSAGVANNPLVVTDVFGSYGEGWNAAALIGYRFTKIFGAELSIGFLYGSKFRNNNRGDGIIAQRNYIDTRLYELTLNPQLIIHFYHNSRWNLYALVGPRFAAWNQFQVKWASKESCSDPDSSYIYEIYHEPADLAIGFTGALRIDYSVSENISLLGEADIVIQDFEYSDQHHFPLFETPFSASSIGFRLGIIYNLWPR